MKAENVIGPASIVTQPERHSLGIRFKTPFDGMFALVTKEMKELRKWVKATGLSEDGPYFLRYYHCDMRSTMEVEVGLMTRSRLAGQGAEVVNMTPPEQDQFFEKERARWAKVVTAAQIRLD